MGKMKLDSLTLRNFKGTRLFTLTAGCVDTTIFGDNATGKTTLADSCSWLLFDKDSLGQAQFEIFPIGEVGTCNSPLESSVEATFINGNPVKLKKIYRELWTKKRGEPKKEKTGNTTDYFIDDVPCKKGEYQEKVASITAKDDLFLLLTNPQYFAGLKWETRRSMIIDMVGDITDADVIASIPELSKLPEILGSKSCEDYKKIVAGRRKEINEQLAGIPGRIDELDRSKPVLEKTNALYFVEKITKLRTKLEEKNNEIAAIKNGGALVELKNKLADINAEIQAMITAHNVKQSSSVQHIKDDLSNLKDTSAEKKRDLRDLITKTGRLEVDLENLKDVNSHLAVQWNEKRVVLFHPESCPTCGKPLTESEAETARMTFNLAKSEELARIQEKAGINKSAAEKIKDDLAAISKAVDITGARIAKIEGKISQAEAQITASKNCVQPLSSPEYVKAVESKTATEKWIDSYQQGAHTNSEEKTAERDVIHADITVAEKELSQIEQAHKIDNRIAELIADEKKLTTAFEVLESHLYLIDLFTRTKVSMLDDKINSKFELVRFRMFRDQVNGGLQPVCDITINGVPYGSLNTGARIQAGMDVIKTFSRHYDFYPVIFVDGCESVTSLPEMEAQVVRLIVSANDKSLRVVQ